MAFDLSTAKPVGGSGFDLSTARPVKLDDLNLRAAQKEDLEGQLAVQRAMNPEQGKWIAPVERGLDMLHQAPAELMNEASGFRMGQRLGMTPAEQPAPFQAGVPVVPPSVGEVTPGAVRTLYQFLKPLQLIQPPMISEEHAQGIAGAGTSLGKFLTGLTTPENLLTLGGAAVAGGASKLLPWIESLFATAPVVSLPGQPSALEEAASRAGEVSVTGTPFEKAEAYTDLGATGVMTPGITAGAMIKGAKPQRYLEPNEMMSIPTVADISEAPGMNEVNPRVGVVPPERQLAQRLYEPGDVNVGVKPQGGARFVVDAAGRVLPTLQDDMQLNLAGMPVEAFTTDETRQAMRGPKEYQAREERVRPAEDPAQLLLPEQPTIPDDLAARLRATFEGRTAPIEPVVVPRPSERIAKEETAGKISFGAEASAESIPKSAITAEAVGGAEQPRGVIERVKEAVFSKDRALIQEERNRLSGMAERREQQPGIAVQGATNADMFRVLDARLEELKTGVANPELDTLRSNWREVKPKPVPSMEVKVALPEQQRIADVAPEENTPEQMAQRAEEALQSKGAPVTSKEVPGASLTPADIKATSITKTGASSRIATPEDWAEWQRLKSLPVMQEGVWQAREAMKNKYGGNPPLEPKGGDQSASGIRSSEGQPPTQGQEPQGRETDSGDVLEQAPPGETKSVGEGRKGEESGLEQTIADIQSEQRGDSPRQEVWDYDKGEFPQAVKSILPDNAGNSLPGTLIGFSGDKTARIGISVVFDKADEAQVRKAAIQKGLKVVPVESLPNGKYKVDLSERSGLGQYFLWEDKAAPDRIAEVSPEAKEEFGGKEPSAQAGIDLGPITDVIERYYKQMETAVKSAPLKETFSRLIDGADGAARAYGKRQGNRIRAVLKSRADRDALTFVMEAFDDRAKLQKFATQVAGTSPHLRRAQEAVQYAIRNYDRLLPHARAALRQMNAQRTLELRNGVATKFYENYIRHVYNNPREVLFDVGQGGNGITTSFEKPRTFATYADAIEAGLRPATLDAANLIESRIASGTKMINRKRWGDSLKTFKDPVSGDPIVVGAGIKPPKGYQVREIVPGVRIAIKDAYTGIFDALTGHSGVRNTVVGRAAINLEGLIKHSLLAADSFHASRIMQKQLAMTGRVGYNRGLSLLEYDMPTLRYMEHNGDISPEIASWVRANKPVGDMLVKEGLNVARIAEAAFADIVRHDIIPNDVLKSFGINAKVPGIGHKDVNVLGQFNKWVFDKVTRGGMMEAAVSEFHRVKDQNPTWTDQKVAAYTAKQVNVFFGNLGRQGIVKSAGGLDVMRLAFLAPQWVESMAQSEIRAAKQIGQIPVDLVRGRGARIGSIGRATGIGLLGYVVATQMVNLFTRGHPTWENEEEGHKLDAWIPDPSGESDGFFVSPLAVFGEMTHDFLRYKGAEDKRGALARIAGNKLSPVFRAGAIAGSGRDYAGNKILDTGEHEVMQEAGKALLPIPLPISGSFSDTPGQKWRQRIGATGLKVEPANRREAEVGALGKLDLSDRVERQREFDAEEKAPLTRQQRYSIAQHAEENTFQREAKVEKDLDSTVRNFLKENKLQITGFKPEFMIAGTKVRLTNAEQETYAAVVVEKYNKMISNVMENGGEVTQKRLNTVLEVARRQAMRQFRQTLEK